MLLTLPTLSASIPAQYVFDAPNPHVLKLAGGMARAGMFSPDMLRDLQPDTLNYKKVRELIGMAWKSELDAPFCGFAKFDLHVELNLPNREGSDGIQEGETGDTYCSVTVSARDGYQTFFVGATIEALEALEPNLGYTVLSVLDKALGLFCIPCTPMGAYWMAQNMYWRGEEDEKAAIEAWGDDEFGEDIVTCDELFDGIPAYAYGKEKFQRLPTTALSEAALRHSAHPLGRIIQRAAALDCALSNTDGGKTWHLMWQVDECEYDGYDLFSPPAVVFWSGESADLTGRIFDDYYNERANCGCEAPFQLFDRFRADAQEIKESLERIRNTVVMCTALDQLLAELPTTTEDRQQ